MIEIEKSAVADTRTCDFTKVTKQELLNASVQIIVEEVTGWKGPESQEGASQAGRRDPHSRVVGARRRQPLSDSAKDER